jgi:hypothetical protein
MNIQRIEHTCSDLWLMRGYLIHTQWLIIFVIAIVIVIVVIIPTIVVIVGVPQPAIPLWPDVGEGNPGDNTCEYTEPDFFYVR